MQSVNINNSFYEKLSQIIQNFDKINIKELEPTTQNIKFEDDLIIVINGLVNLYSKEANEGKEEEVSKQHIIDYINNCKINLREIYNWLLNNQNNSNSNWLLGFFNYHGIETNINRQKAFELYKTAAELENNVAQFDLACMYMAGCGTSLNYEKAFELSKKLAEKESLAGINLLGYCYDCGIGTDVDMQKAFELYQKAANLGNCLAQSNIAFIYENGNEIEKDMNQAIYWYKKSAEQGNEIAQNQLEKFKQNGFPI